jgi:hypothetical protein
MGPRSRAGVPAGLSIGRGALSIPVPFGALPSPSRTLTAAVALACEAALVRTRPALSSGAEARARVTCHRVSYSAVVSWVSERGSGLSAEASDRDPLVAASTALRLLQSGLEAERRRAWVAVREWRDAFEQIVGK